MSYPNKNISLISTYPKWGQVVLTGLKVFLVASSSVLFLSVYQPVLAANLRGQELEIIRLTNQVRQAQGISILEINAALTASARAKAQDMADRSYFSHADSNGNRMVYWIRASGYDYLRAGENLAKGFTDPKELIQTWTHSPTHYANLINSRYRDLGVGIAEGYIDGRLTIFVVQHFGEPMPIVKIFSVEVSRPINPEARVLGDQLKSALVVDITSETMTEISSSGATAINKSPAALLWVAYQEAGNIIQQPVMPVVAAKDINLGLPDRGYQSAQILFMVLAFLGLWGWLSMLTWPIYAWLGKLRNRSD